MAAFGFKPQGLPPLPGEGIVPAPAPQYVFAQPVAAAPAPAEPVQDSFAPPKPQTGALAKVGGILGTLLGWKHAEELQKRHDRVAFLQSTIHDALTNENNRLPREDLDRYVSELSQNLESSSAPKIRNILKNHVDQVFQARDIAKKQAALNASQPVQQAPPATPAPSPGGVTQNPFGTGAGNDATPAPPLDSPPAFKTASEASGAGFGSPALTAQAAPRSHIISRSQLAEEKAQADIAAQRIKNTYDDERIQAAIKRLDDLVGPEVRKSLRPSQIASFIKEGSIPELKMDVLKEGDVGVYPGGKVVAGVPKPISTAPNTITTVPPYLGGVAPGTPYDPAQPNPMTNPPSGITGNTPTAASGAPTGPGGYEIKGGPALSTAQQGANAWWESNHPGQTLTPANYAEAMAGFQEASMSASARQLRDAQITSAQEAAKMRRVQEAHLAQTMREYERTKGPEAVASLADQVKLNPDLLQSLSSDVKDLVVAEFPKRFGLPAPRQIPALARNSEVSAQLALSNVKQMREALQNKALQKRIGAWDGRLGNIEQQFGNTAGLSAEDSRAIQRFRTGLTYLFMSEGKALFGGRAPQALMQELSKTSPNVKMGMPILLGSLDGVEDAANNIIDNANDYRYGSRSMTNPPPGTPTHSVPELGSTFNGGRVLKVTPVK